MGAATAKARSHLVFRLDLGTARRPRFKDLSDLSDATVTRGHNNSDMQSGASSVVLHR